MGAVFAMVLKWIAVTVQGFMVIGAFSASESFVGEPVFQAGVARVCPGNDLSITCTHLTTVTAWRASSTTGGVVCVASILHASPDVNAGCGNPAAVFTIDGISNTNTSPNCSSSTARITGTADVDGLTIECLNDPGVTNQVGTVDISLIGQSAPGNLCLLAGDITEVAGSVPHQWDVTLRWDEPVLQPGVTVSSYVSTATPPAICVSDCTGSNTFRTWRLELDSPANFTVAAVGTTNGNACTVTSEPSEAIVNIFVPEAPVINDVEVTFNQSTGIITAVITPNDNLNAPPNIAESGTKVLDGSIIEYIASLMIGDTPTSCEGLTCTATVSEGFSTTPFVITVATRNAVGAGPSTVADGVLFTVSRENGATADSVTLTCDGASDCAIMYGREIDNVSETGMSGVALENLVTNKIYFYEARTTDGVVNVTVTDSFGTCECPSSGLFAGAATEAATCPQEFTGGLRTSSSNGTACYSGLTADSTAVFMCDVCGAECTGVCEAVCVCPSGQTEGQWSSSFENAACVVHGTNLSSSIAIAVVVTFLLTLLIGVPLGMLLMYCITWKTNTARTSSAEPHTAPATTAAAAAAAPVYDVVGPGPEKFEMEGNTAYGPVRR